MIFVKYHFYQLLIFIKYRLMELRHLQYFAMVADELHFRRAAEKLFMSQPPLSRQIKELEVELGVQLFIRSNKKVELTNAGKYLRKEVNLLFRQIEKFKKELVYINQQTTGRFRIGYISSTFHDDLMQAVNWLYQKYPLIKTQLFEIPTIEQVKAIETDQLDIGILRAPVYSELLEIKTLFFDPFVFVTTKEISNFRLLDFAEEPFIFFNREFAPDFYLKLLEICNRNGFTPEIVHEANNVHSILKMVAKNMGVSILPQTVADHVENEQLKYYKINAPMNFTEVVIAWKTGSKNPIIFEFAEQMKKQFV